MTAIWRFTDLEFLVLWERSAHDLLPPPFEFISTTPQYYGYLREKRATADRLGEVERSFAPALEVLVRPDIRIVVHGWEGMNPRPGYRRIRMLAARRDNRGFLVTQLPGHTPTYSGGFTVNECDPLDLAAAVVGALPVTAPGICPTIELTSPDEKNGDIDYDYGRSRIAADSEPTPPALSREFLRTRPTMMGTIDVIQGHSRFGPRGITRHCLEWRDLPGDGRYAVRHAPPWEALAVDPTHLTTMINARIAQVLQVIEDERPFAGT